MNEIQKRLALDGRFTSATAQDSDRDEKVVTQIKESA
jgi:hypothetical protein